MNKDDIIKGLNGYDPWRNSEGYVYRPELANKAIAFAETVCCHVKGTTGRLILAPWQRAHTLTLFGWIDPETGYRRYRTSSLFIARKGGKSTYSAYLGLYFCGLDKEPGAECVLGAGCEDQTKYIFEAMAGMVKAEPILTRHFVLRESQGKIIHPASNSYIKRLPHEGNRSLGANLHFAAIDEISFFKPKSTLIESLSTSTGCRNQSLLLLTSTAGYDRESPGYAEWCRAARIKEEYSDPTYLPVIYAANPDIQDWSSEETFASTNPTYCVGFPKKSFFESERNKALAFPSEVEKYKRFYLNIWSAVSSRFLRESDIDMCVDSKANLKGATLQAAGLDVSASVDTTALVRLYKLPNGKLFPKLTTWISEKTIREATIAKWERWIRDPRCDIRVIPGEVIDKNRLFDDIVSIHKDEAKENPQVQYFYDRSYAVQLIKELSMESMQMVSFSQSFANFSAPTRELERLIRCNELVFSGDPCLQFQLANVEVKFNEGDQVRPIKQSRQHVNDAVIALTMAIQGHLLKLKPYHSVFYGE